MKKLFPTILIASVLVLTTTCKKDDEYSTVTDIDGNIYRTVKIGTQEWLAENLKTTRFNDGEAIPLVNGNAERDGLITPGNCLYNNIITSETYFKNTYGILYNWYTINTGKLCPAGWHVPTDDEWSTMTTYLGGDTIAGKKLKETGTAWFYCEESLFGGSSPGNEATNESGFSARPGGCYRSRDSMFYDNGFVGYWWSATEYDSTYAWRRYIACGGKLFRGNDKKKTDGLSVRCVRD